MINTSISMQRSIMANLETRSTYLLESTTRNDVFLPNTNTKRIVKPFDLKFRGEKLKTIRRLILSVRPGSERLRNRRTNRDELREGRDGKSLVSRGTSGPPAGKAHAAKRSPPDRTHLRGIVACPRVASIFTNRLLMQQDVYTRYRCRRVKSESDK